jgi:hypothetical protein
VVNKREKEEDKREKSFVVKLSIKVVVLSLLLTNFVLIHLNHTSLMDNP